MKLHLIAGLVALLYVATATHILREERSRPSGGGWNSLQGMGTLIATAPVTLVRLRFGGRFDLRNNTQMVFAIATCAVLVYGVTFGSGKLIRLLFFSRA